MYQTLETEGAIYFFLGDMQNIQGNVSVAMKWISIPSPVLFTKWRSIERGLGSGDLTSPTTLLMQIP